MRFADRLEMLLRRVLFVGWLNPGSSCVPRMRALQRLGLDVDTLDVDWPGEGSRLERWLAYRTNATPAVLKLNLQLISAAARYKPDVIWIEKGCWVYPTTLGRLRRHARFIVQYNTDDLFGRGTPFWLARLGLRRYDMHLTTNRFNVGEISRAGARSLRVGMGYDEELHRPPQLQPDTRRRVVFIGHWEPHTERYVAALRRGGVPVDVWGGGWKHANLPELRSVGRLPHDQYAATIASSALALCSLSRVNRNESTGRSFEIPAIGGCLLAERTEEHEYLYRDGVDAVLFSDENELVRKARHYLDQDDERSAISRCGQQRLHALGLSWSAHVQREWQMIERWLCDGQPPRSGVDDAPFWPGFRSGAPVPS